MRLTSGLHYAKHAAQHGEPVSAAFVDPYSSASYGDYPKPQTWLLDVGWYRAPS